MVSLLAVPLSVRDRTIGVLNCYTTQRVVFSDEQIALFATLANQTALAIENARLVTNAAVVRRDAPSHQKQSANGGHAHAAANPRRRPPRHTAGLGSQYSPHSQHRFCA
ncbi:MAG: GAF domain-containing protein [Chloroflexi bacterium]|nr:GAF domain-containing protein [Chloroflexota bacterium]